LSNYSFKNQNQFELITSSEPKKIKAANGISVTCQSNAHMLYVKIILMVTWYE
jgi:hypothetical protein